MSKSQARFALAFLIVCGSCASVFADELPLVEVRVLEDFEGQAKARGWGEKIADGRTGKAGFFVVADTGKPMGGGLDYRDRGIEISEWDELVFDYRISGPGLKWWGVKVVDYPLVDGRQAVWQITDPNLLKPGRWHTAVIDIRRPMWRWGGQADKRAQYIWFRAELHRGAEPVEILVDNIRVRRKTIRMQVQPPAKVKAAGRVAAGTWIVKLTNLLSQPVTCSFRAKPQDKRLTIQGLPRRVAIPPKQSIQVEIQGRLDIRGAYKLWPYEATLQLVAEPIGRVVSEEVIRMTVPLGELPHPLLLIRRDEVPQILEATKKNKRMKAAFDALIRTADSWLQRKLDFPDRGAQWWHWYTCKKCGCRLKTEGPHRHVCPNCGAVYSGWPYDDVVLSRQHHALSNGARELGLAYILTGKREYARRAIDILLGYSERYEKYPLHNIHGKPVAGGGHVGAQTLDEATWLIPIAQAFDAVQDAMTPEERKQIIDHLLLPAAKTTWSPRMSIHNISCWRNSAYALVGLALDDEEMVAAAYAGKAGFLNQLSKGVIPPGFWYEGSWGYHFYTMSALLPFVEAGLRAGLKVLLDEYRAMYEAPLSFLTPDMRLPAFNDSGYARPNPLLYAIAYRHFKDPRFAWVARRNPPGGWLALIWGPCELPEGQTTFSSQLYPKAGYALFRTWPWNESKQSAMPPNYLAIDFGPHGGGHGHPDKLNFVWWALGELMAPDPGSISYGNPMHQGYYKQTLAHNTVVVDGHSQAACTGQCLFYAADGNLGVAAVSTDAAYPGVELIRVCAVAGQRVIDIFIARADKQHRLEWVYHNRGKFSCDVNWQEMPSPPEGAGYKWCKQWRQAQTAGPVAAKWELDNGKGIVLYHLPQPNETLLTALGPDQPPSELVPLLIEQVVGKKETVWLNVLQAYDQQPPVLKAQWLAEELAGGKFVVEADDGDSRDVLLVSLDGSEVEAAGLRLTGQCALLHYESGQLRSVLTAGTSKVWVGSQRVK